MADAIIWYLIITALGWLVFPLAYRLLPGLADRGYAISRSLGLLLWGYIFWLLASLGALPNQPSGLLFAAVLLGGLCLWALRGIHPQEMLAWLRAQRFMLITVEVLFLLAFALYAWVRAANPEAVGTEKPMELAFINAILHSPAFPPHDPWLSGYGISYYYFGYILVAMLARLAGTSGGVAFNLGIVLVFALSAIGAYGLLFNLLNAAKKPSPEPGAVPAESPNAAPRFTLASLLAPLFLLLVSNLEGFLHALHTRGLFWGPDGTSAFWSWLGILDLNQPPAQPLSWMPTRFWWWWRASRVVQDYDLAGGWREIIDEFPFFSFLLADLHPHVLAMPFALLVLTLALGLFLDGGTNRPIWLRLRIQPGFFLLTAVALGGLAFLNTWDFPLYVALVAAAYGLGRVLNAGERLGTAAKDFAWLALGLGVCGGLLYLPFYLGFSSQAGGPLPNLIYPTRGAHLWVMFGALLLPILAYLIYLARSAGQRGAFRKALGLSLALLLVLWALAIALGMAITFLPEYAGLYLGTVAAANRSELLAGTLSRRFTSPGGWVTLLGLLTLTIGLVWSAVIRRQRGGELENHPPGKAKVEESDLENLSAAHIFAVLLTLFGTLLVVGPEFFYLRDLFGWRMNTIFKFYYQAWLVWSIAAAFASVTLLTRLRGGWKAAFSIGLALLLAASLVYPLFSLWNKTNGFQPDEWTLDSTAYFARQSPDEMSAVRWLEAALPGVVAEAVPQGGGSYTEYARMATLSGQPAVLGWVGHENQWRGDTGEEAIGSRQADLERLFCGRDWEETRAIIEKYDIRYIVVGNLERATYQASSGACPQGVADEKFQRYLQPAFQAGPVTIFVYNGSDDE